MEQTSTTTTSQAWQRFSGGGLKEYVAYCGGKRVIEKVLIANNGIAAVKAMRSIRRWAYETFGKERTVRFVVMATPEDLKANAEFIRMADQFEEVPGGANVNNYANVKLIVDIAERTGVQAVWAGWGHASENPKLPEALAHANIAFMGPPAKAMRDLGDKICSTIIAQSADVPVVPWSGQAMRINYRETGVTDAMMRQARVMEVAEAREVLQRIGYPAMIKASEGGGGKGIRKVVREEELESAFRQVANEVKGSPIFIMKLVSQCHHLEVQVLADQYGEAISLSGRDCSVQRRHQKIIEEGPVVVAPPDVLQQMEQAAVRMAREVGYEGVGTVEYLYGTDGKYYFLELNPRLQVEHPVTEQITQVNLPAAQLHVAMGIPLHRQPEIRKYYNEEAWATSPFDLHTKIPRQPHGHVIACRITAENPDQGFKPTSGTIQFLNFYSSPRVWAYFSVDGTGSLHEFADSQFGHLFSWGASREESRTSLVLALKELSIRGEVRTPVEVLIHLLETEEFKTCGVHTGWLDEIISREVNVEKPDTFLVVICGAIFKAYSQFMLMRDEYVSALRKGQIPSSELLITTLPVQLIYRGVKYSFQVKRSGPKGFLILLDGGTTVIEAEVHALRGEGLIILLDGKSHVCYGKEEAIGLRLTIGAQTCMFTKEHDPTVLRTATPCKLVRFLVENGAHVAAGNAYAEVEVMKMYMPLITKEAGHVHFTITEGAILSAGDVVATMVLDDPSQVQRAQPYEGSLPELGKPRPIESKAHQLLRTTYRGLQATLEGYENPNVRKAVEEFFAYVHDPALPALECQELLSSLVPGPAPAAQEAVEKVEQLIQAYCLACQSPQSTPRAIEFPAAQVLAVLQAQLEKLTAEEAKVSEPALRPLADLARKFLDGTQGYAFELVSSLLRDYLVVERMFLHRQEAEVLLELRDKHKDDLTRTLDIALAHSNQVLRAKLVVALLDQVSARHWHQIERYVPLLQDLSLLTGKSHTEVSLRVREMLIRYQLPSFAQRRATVENFLLATAQLQDDTQRLQRVNTLVDESASVFDVLLSLLSHENEGIRKLALETYIRRTYRTYRIHSFELFARRPSGATDSWPFAEFRFAQPDIHSPSTVSSDLSPRLRADAAISLTLAAKKHFQPDTKSEIPFVSPESADDLMLLERSRRLLPSPAPSQERVRYGLFLVFRTFSEMTEQFEAAMQHYIPPPRFEGEELLNVLGLILPSGTAELAGERALVAQLADFLRARASTLRDLGVRRVTAVVGKGDNHPECYTFRERLEYGEDPIYRHLEPPLAFHLELRRLSNYDIQLVPTANRQLHLYYAQQLGHERSPSGVRRYFVRAIIRGGSLLASPSSSQLEDLLQAQAERAFTESLRALELATQDTKRATNANHHIFLKFVPDVAFEPERVGRIIQHLGERYGQRLWRLQVGEVEVMGMIRQGGTAIPVRFFASNPTGYHFRVESYIEVREQDAERTLVRLAPLHPRSECTLAGREVGEPYPVIDPLEQRRLVARQNQTTYVYDFLELFAEALRLEWHAHLQQKRLHTRKPVEEIPQRLVHAVELLPDDSAAEGLREAEDGRGIGKNKIGMVAWRLTLYTPEYPTGRVVVLIGNDIAHQSGSFGPQEDQFFYNVSRYARKRGQPRIYLAANSGARIGLAQEVKEKFRVSWVDPKDPSKGFRHLFLSDSDHEALAPYVNAQKASEDEWKLIDIIGREDGLGVENLRGSGLIAGETSRAYEEIFTLTLVTGRTVGIGAYLIRLGQRTVQNEGPILLTGAPALNKVLGREVYTSNVQLGGPQIMYTNGVSHVAVNDDLKAVAAIVRWLGYIPRARGLPLPTLWNADPVDRKIEFTPRPSTPYDPRHMLAGCEDGDGRWISGFFDRGSFTETLAGWAKTVVCGRARLGGIPIGVIAAETRMMERVVPADPANQDSQQSVVQQAGGVWFPDSAYKTAQAIKDFNRGEELPLIIFANWRGFSGGMRDMFDEILKFGAYIVDNLRDYQQPVFVYMPPCGELRGGAWAVLDPTINPEFMEMYAAEDSRGGVLEPSGTVEIKYRDRDLRETMRRLDPQLIELHREVKTAGEEQRKQLLKQIKLREDELIPTYRQVAIEFAGLHDTPGRMKAKGVISQVVPWAQARCFFYHRLRRRMAELQLHKRLATISQLSVPERSLLVRRWFAKFNGLVTPTDETKLTDLWTDDAAVHDWLEGKQEAIEEEISKLRHEALRQQGAGLAAQDLSAWTAMVTDTIAALPVEKRQEIAKQLASVCQ